MSERFVCVLTWRYISIVYTLSLCCPVWQTASLYVVIAVCQWLNKDNFTFTFMTDVDKSEVKFTTAASSFMPSYPRTEWSEDKSFSYSDWSPVTSAPVGCEVLQWACLSVSLSIHTSQNTMSILHKFSVHVSRGRGSLFLLMIMQYVMHFQFVDGMLWWAHRYNTKYSLDTWLANQTVGKGVVTIVCRIEILKMAEC